MRLDQKAELLKHTVLKDIQIIQVHQQHKKSKTKYGNIQKNKLSKIRGENDCYYYSLYQN